VSERNANSPLADNIEVLPLLNGVRWPTHRELRQKMAMEQKALETKGATR